MSSKTKQSNEPFTREEQRGALAIERDRRERERGRQEERERYTQRRGVELYEQWLATMRAKFVEQAGAEFDAKKPPVTFERIALIHRPEKPNYVTSTAEMIPRWQAALDYWTTKNPHEKI